MEHLPYAVALGVFLAVGIPLALLMKTWMQRGRMPWEPRPPNTGQRSTTWKAASTALNLAFRDSPSLSLRGQYRGRQVVLTEDVIKRVSRDRRGKKRVYMEITCQARTILPASLPGKIAVRSTTLTDRAVQLARPDMQIGDKDFDRQFTVDGEEDVVRRLLTPEVRGQLHRVARHYPRLELTDRAVFWRTGDEGLLTTPSIRNALNAQAALLDAIWDAAADARDEEPFFDEVREAQRQ